MQNVLGEALSGFAAEWARVRESLEPYPGLAAFLYTETAEWERLLHYKLLPHFEGEGCLVVAVAGGTNTGKSTVFNLLLGQEISPVRATAAATSRPLLAANRNRYAQCIEGRLAPEFRPMAFQNAESVLDGDAPGDVLYVTQREDLPDRLVLLDIPDIDSIERTHWDLAENIQAAGDVLVAVLTGEKYQDDRVISFFRRAHAAGRVILPLMNKANPRDQYAVARAQLAEFCRSVGLESPPCFVLPHDYDLLATPGRTIDALGKGVELRAYLESLQVPIIKQRVYRDSLARFAAQSEGLLEHQQEAADILHRVADEFRTRLSVCAAAYDPEPGADVGAILHQFIQSKRGMFIRAFGWAGQTVGRVLSPASRAVRWWLSGSGGAGRASRNTQEDIRSAHARSLETLSRDLIREYIQTASNLHPLAAELITPALEALDAEPLVRCVTEATMQADDVSAAFRAHVEKTLDNWWEDHAIRRWLFLELDALLVLSPAAVAVPLSFYTGGVGVPEMLAATSPLAGELFARIMEHQFADKWFDLIAPWRAEQQQRFAEALTEHLAQPALRALEQARETIEGEPFERLRRYHDQCRTA